MKKKFLSILVAMAMSLSLLPVTALAALPNKIDAPQNPKAALDDDVPGKYMDFTDEIIISFGLTDEHRSLLAGDAAAMILQVDWSINSETDWKCSGQNDWPDYFDGSEFNGPDVVTLTSGDIVDQVGILRSNYSYPALHGYDHICHGIDDTGYGWFDLENNTIYFKLRFVMRDYEDNKVYSDWTEVFTIGKEVDEEAFEASSWAQSFIHEADEKGLIPDCLVGADLTKPINRAEFAAVAVKTYESLSGKTAQPGEDPFKDTDDPEILKAFALGVATGTSADTFSPAMLLTREQASVMLTRVYQRATIPGWPENNPPLSFAMPAPFADDADISDWAKECVYFMAANGIISGVGNNCFAPKNVTSAQEASGYANATREQALIIAVALSNKFG